MTNTDKMPSSVDKVSHRAQAHAPWGMGLPIFTLSIVKQVPCLPICDWKASPYSFYSPPSLSFPAVRAFVSPPQAHRYFHTGP